MVAYGHNVNGNALGEVYNNLGGIIDTYFIKVVSFDGFVLSEFDSEHFWKE